MLHQIPQLLTVDALLSIYGKEMGVSIHTTDKTMVESIKEKYPKSEIYYYIYLKLIRTYSHCHLFLF
ncbi:hypothetical protein [Candidatus Harpocratesius sp.]